MIERLKDPAILISIMTLVFYTGGFVLLTKNHLKHLADDVKSLMRGQRKMEERMARIEWRMKHGE